MRLTPDQKTLALLEALKEEKMKDNPMFRTDEDWSKRCDKLAQELKAAKAEVEEVHSMLRIALEGAAAEKAKSAKG